MPPHLDRQAAFILAPAVLIALLFPLLYTRFLLENTMAPPRICECNITHPAQHRAPPDGPMVVEEPPGPQHAPPFDVVVVGAGLSGAVIAERFASVLGKRVLLVEKRDHIGGNCYDYEDPDTGILVNKYGAHLFHTNNEEVWNYVRKHGGDWCPWEHHVLGYVKPSSSSSPTNQYVPIPVNLDTVNLLFNTTLQTSEDMQQWLLQHQLIPAHGTIRNSEEMALSRVGRELYELIFKPYTEKQWNTNVASLGPEVTGRIPVRDNRDGRYFSDKYQALPCQGYTSFFRRLLFTNPLIEVHTSTDYFELGPALQARIPATAQVFYTGPIDQFFPAERRLQYRSLRFSRVVVYNQRGFSLPAPVVNYPGKEYPFTRVVEYKHMLSQRSSATVLFYEYPSDTGEPYYPVPTPENKDLYRRLLELTKTIPHVTFVGRLANYKYFNMDEAIANALSVFRAECCKPKADIHVVTSVFTENLDWMQTLCQGLPGLAVRWFVFNKNDDPNHAASAPPWTVHDGTPKQCTTLGWHQSSLPNVGREGHSWLTYLQAGVLARTNVFLQGNPEGSMNDIINAVLLQHTDRQERERVRPLTNPLCRPNDDFFFDMPFFHSELDALSSYLHTPLDSNDMCYFYRGQFIASEAALERARTQHTEFIGNVLMPALEGGNDPPMGHALERMWLMLLDWKNKT